ncbi:alcohol dehydrogenase [Salinimicrobium marinum]|uniref:Alcohol dehydrogenase n=1 Tax=Salinimicrobium marinum TaxID=680283 RepID=A0A918VUR2_9FLAO|nr:NAD(P)-dependent alcohol dehydrogenase [Salinimicrobium marinum]GHA26063.1 alcohol dehydrogenase [Salinimicrobium marinum]
MKNKKMKAMLAMGYGSPDVLQLKEVEIPTPSPNEVLVKVKTSSATTADTMMRTGKPYIGRLFLGFKKPKHPIPGTGFAGIVEEVGTKVNSLKVGDRVFGETTLGFSANAEYLTVSGNGVVLLMPENMDFNEAASFGDGHLTSYNFLKEIAEVQPGERVLINGASGALGTSAVQIAKYFGSHVTAVCSSRNFELVKSLGADELMDYRKKDFTKSGQKFDYVYDTVGKSSFKKCRKILSEKGIYLSPVLKMSLLIDMLKTSLTRKKKAIFQATGTKGNDKLRVLLINVLDIYKEGKLKTVVDRQFTLEKLGDAHKYIETGHKRGNVIIANYFS